MVKKVYGGFTKWYTYKDLKVQGTFELRTCKILDTWQELKLIKNWEYTNDRISYIGEDGNKHMYLLDFKILNNDNSEYYIEVKGFKTKKDDLKWFAAKEQGLSLKIWFNKEIIENEKALAVMGSNPI